MTEPFGNETVEDVSEAFNLLRNARRRGVLYTLERNERTSVEALASRIAEWQSEESERAPDAGSVETSLVHSHLPKLDAAGVIEYDRDEQVVELAEAAGDLGPLLECTREREVEFSAVSSLQTSSV
jgi:hypothetical protein